MAHDPANRFCRTNSGAVAVDLSTPVTDTFLSKMEDVGIRTVIRYYDHTNETLPGKTLKKQELPLIAQHQLSLAVVFQHHNNQIATFTTARGSADANRSVELAGGFKQAPDSAIYFGVDGGWKESGELSAIKSYFAAVRPVISQAGFRVGVYGSGKVCQFLTDQHLVDLCWLANAKGWPDYDQYFNSKRWRLAQFLPEDCGGLNVDFNIGNGVTDDHGQFSPLVQDGDA